MIAAPWKTENRGKLNTSLLDILADDWPQSIALHVRNDLTLNAAFTFKHAEYDCFSFCATTTFSAFAFSSDISFVNLDVALE